MSGVERPILFNCAGDQLVGSLSLPAQPVDVGVVVVVGGPQYRGGSHRQFVQLTRALAAAGVAALRFDYRGMGDSEGDPHTFDTIDDDIACAVNELQRLVPSVHRVVLWGLCDGASAALIAVRSLRKVAGVVAVNPWVRSDASLDAALVRHYYTKRLVSREFWTKLVTGKLGIARASTEFMRRSYSAIASARRPGTLAGTANVRSVRFQDLMSDGLAQLAGPVLFILSGRDLTAREFAAFADSDAGWKAALARNPSVTTKHFSEADHTFSSRAQRIEVERLSCDFALALCLRKTEPAEEWRQP
jgi:exosortase A-associated hydrolase 1